MQLDLADIIFKKLNIDVKIYFYSIFRAVKFQKVIITLDMLIKMEYILWNAMIQDILKR